MNYSKDDVLMHYGMPRRSGRYPWGSGDTPYQRSGDFLSRIEELKKQGLSETKIAEALGLTTTQLRAQKAMAKTERRALEVATAKGLRKKGLSLNEIAEKMGYNNDSSIRTLLNENSEARMNQARKTAEFLKKQVEEKGMLDVGVGVEKELNISKEKMKEALYMLEMEGYEVYGRGLPQVTNPGKQTNILVLCPPGTEHSEIYKTENIKSVKDYISHDGGETFDKFVYPKSMDSNRLQIRYAEDGGIDKDGVVELRRGVDDLSLGESRYAQVRILVDGNKFIKGVAIYSDDLPDGVDVMFNTNKRKGTPKEDVLKNIKDDPDNPFGSLIKAGGQSYYIDKNGERQLSLINKRAEEGDWGDWKDKLPSQFLAKQNMSLIKKQLDLAAVDKYAEFDEIMSLTNPTVKKALLKSFSDDCDSAAVHLYAAALPRQKHQLLLPIPSMKDTEVYAPNYKNGEQVALIRYPHGGTFEIPILTVNNKHKVAKGLLGNVMDAVGINSKVAERLSGADFDGDTVMVIPTGGKIKITSTPPLKGLEGFDAKMEYPYYKGMSIMKNTQTEMGKISNLITDMTLKGASPDELARAVRHSMVVIDAEKHKLDYKKSKLENGITALEKKYKTRTDEHGKESHGASTLLSRAKGEVTVIKRRGSPIIDKETGAQTWKEVDNPLYVDKTTGVTKTKTQKSTQMFETPDARSLSSGTPQEEAYATYANQMKALANRARKEMVATGKIPYSSTAKATYQKEVATLTAKLNTALRNAPREREAQRIANVTVNAKKLDNPSMSKGDVKKASQQALTSARLMVGAKREPVAITDREWQAIQSGAISEKKLVDVINNIDVDVLRQRATPRTTTTLSNAKISKITSMNNSGYTNAEIAAALGVSTSTVIKYLK